jgi:hypothetical protein
MTHRHFPARLACLALVLALAALALACDGEGPAEPTGIAEDDPACQYELTDLSTDGPETASKEFPPGLYPSEYRELGSGLNITLVDPLDETRELFLTVPQCKKEEALAVIEARQQANEDQEADGIPFEQRIFE